MRILAISGSPRSGSSNTSLVEAATLVAPPGVEVAVHRGLSGLPPAALLISCPEYAQGAPGSLKNALDRVVGSGDGNAPRDDGAPGSSNTSLPEPAASVAPPGVEVTVYRGISGLPPAALLTSCPEYAQGAPGSLKNALDRVVGRGDGNAPRDDGTPGSSNTSLLEASLW